MRRTSGLLGLAALFAAVGVVALAAPISATSRDAPMTHAAATTASQHAADLAELESPYAIGSPRTQRIWVDPRNGDDARNGRTRATAVRTLTEAWNRIPAGRTLATGVRIMITRGTVTSAMAPTYWENRLGTATAPIIIQSADGRGAARLPSMNVYGVSHLYLLGLRLVSRSGDALHCERCDNLLVRNSIIRGDRDGIHDLVKVNQSREIYFERNDISGANENSVDFVAVQYGVLRDNRIHDAGDWCAYAKGGSAYIRINGNEIYDCGTGGFTAGQGTGFQFMVAPWLQYEAYDVAVTNNVVRDTQGAGLGVNGGFQVLLAYNTLVRVGSRSHLLEFVPGHRSCDGQPGDPERERCAQYLGAGGWGTTRVDDGSNYVRIPNARVYVYNNIIVNPRGAGSAWQHLDIAGPYSGSPQNGSGVPTPTRFDTDLRIAGNLISDGPPDHPSGIGSGCPPGHATCSEERYRSDNWVNTRQPSLTDTMHLVDSSSYSSLTRRIPDFPSTGWPTGVPAGRTTNAVPDDRAGQPRGTTPPPGAYRT